MKYYYICCEIHNRSHHNNESYTKPYNIRIVPDAALMQQEHDA